MILRIIFTVVASVAGVCMGLLTNAASSRAIAHHPEATIWASILIHLTDGIPVLYFVLCVVACWRWHRSLLLRWVTVCAHAVVLLGAVYVSLNVDEFALLTIATAVGFVSLFFAAVVLPQKTRVGVTANAHYSV
jgi:hypothetical protein